MTAPDFEVFVVTWAWQSRAHLCDFEDRDTALAFAMHAREQGREKVYVGHQQASAPIPEGVAERVWRAVVARLQDERVMLLIRTRAAENALSLYETAAIEEAVS